jgi:uncharacterized protein (TIGR02300 family)
MILLLTAAMLPWQRPARGPDHPAEAEDMLTKPDWGSKRICPNCGTRYYDMQRDPITCPKCGAPFDLEALTKTSRKSRAASAVVAVVEEVVPTLPEEEELADLAAEPDGDAAISPAPVAPGALPAAAAVDGELPVEGEEGAVKGKDDEEEEEVIEDASELGEDEDDMAEVIEKVEDDDERG